VQSPAEATVVIVDKYRRAWRLCRRLGKRTRQLDETEPMLHETA
jgi:hypothetical protein